MLKRSGDLFLGSKCCVVMQIGVRMQIVVCISMIDFMPGNGDCETGIFATLRKSGATSWRYVHDDVISHITKWWNRYYVVDI